METSDDLEIIKEDVYETIKYIKDPEFPQYTLVELGVLEPDSVTVYKTPCTHTVIQVTFKPTTTGCSMASLIGLSIRRKLEFEFEGSEYKIDLFLLKDSHTDEINLNRLMNDKERAAAALEKPLLRSMVESAIEDPT